MTPYLGGARRWEERNPVLRQRHRKEQESHQRCAGTQASGDSFLSSRCAVRDGCRGNTQPWGESPGAGIRERSNGHGGVPGVKAVCVQMGTIRALIWGVVRWAKLKRRT